MMRRIFAISLLLLGFALTPVAPAQAMTPVTQVAACAAGASNFFGFQPWHACLPKNSDGSPKLTKLTDVFKIAFPIVEWIIKAAAYVAIGMIFYMLFKIATSRGNASQYGTAIGGIRDAIIGLIIAMLSVAILNFIAGAFK
jgi:hypothetical protein